MAARQRKVLHMLLAGTEASPPARAVAGGTVHSLHSARVRRTRRPGAIRVLLVGSQALTRAGLRRLLEDDAGVAVVAEAADGRDGARLARALRPDVVVLDAGRREPDPAVTAGLLARAAAVLLLTDCPADERALAAVRAGAVGVLPKDCDPVVLPAAVRTLAAGGALLPPRATRRLIAELADPS